jgi:cytochrome c-type biogenesis protein CcmH/NrfG
MSAEAQAEEGSLLGHYNRAHAALRTNNQNTASVEFKAFIGEAIHRVANARARIGEFDDVDQEFDEALSLADADPEIRLDYASVLFDQGRLSEAHSMAQSALDLDPKNARARIVLGRISFQEKQYAAAAVQFEAAAAAGEFTEIWRLLALSYLRLQQPDRAEPVLTKALNSLGDTAGNHVLVGTIYYYGDYPKRALAELRKALAQDPREPNAHYYLGLAYLGNDEGAGYASAVREFEAQLQEYPEDFRSRYMLGYIALQQRQFEKAEHELSQAARINPNDQGTRLLLARLYSETNRQKQAKDVLQALTAPAKGDKTVDFTVIRAHYMLGRLLQQEGQFQEGTNEIAIAERLRRQLRTSATEAYAERTSAILAGQAPGTAVSQSVSRQVSPEEQARAKAFVQQLKPLIGEAYYNLARISTLHQDPANASRYSARAAAWDPSLASSENH